MTTPPGPHAMTAQAGAVACDVVWPDGAVVATRVDIDYADELLSQYKWRDCKKVNFLYPTPPAAVPVEALEGLVRGWQEMLNIEYHLCADELTQLIERSKGLIKERSNGA